MLGVWGFWCFCCFCWLRVRAEHAEPLGTVGTLGVEGLGRWAGVFGDLGWECGVSGIVLPRLGMCGESPGVGEESGAIVCRKIRA